MKTRINKWINTKTLKVRLGIDVRVGKRWLPLAENGKAKFFRSVKALNKYREKLRRYSNE